MARDKSSCPPEEGCQWENKLSSLAQHQRGGHAKPFAPLSVQSERLQAWHFTFIGWGLVAKQLLTLVRILYISVLLSSVSQQVSVSFSFSFSIFHSFPPLPIPPPPSLSFLYTHTLHLLLRDSTGFGFDGCQEHWFLMQIISTDLFYI